MNPNSDNGDNNWQGFNAAVMINGFNYYAENISAVSKSGIKKSRRTEGGKIYSLPDLNVEGKKKLP